MSTLGPRSFAVLSAAGIAGVCLAIVGWNNRATGLVSSLIASQPPPAASASATPGPGSTPTPAGTASPAASATAGATTGPLLSSEPYASYAYQIWPGPVSSNAQLAMAGFTVHVAKSGKGITVSAAQTGQSAGSPHLYPTGAKVYMIDSNLGDEGGSVDYNVSDDGLIVTNAQGQMLQ